MSRCLPLSVIGVSRYAWWIDNTLCPQQLLNTLWYKNENVAHDILGRTGRLGIYILKKQRDGQPRFSVSKDGARESDCAVRFTGARRRTAEMVRSSRL